MLNSMRTDVPAEFTSRRECASITWPPASYPQAVSAVPQPQSVIAAVMTAAMRSIRMEPPLQLFLVRMSVHLGFERCLSTHHKARPQGPRRYLRLNRLSEVWEQTDSNIDRSIGG